MKKALFGILIFLSGQSFSQSTVTILSYSEVIQMDSIPKAELFSRAQMAFVTIFRSSKDVIQLADKENGKIVGKALFSYNPTIFIGNMLTRGLVRYTISIQVKDGRYKYEITDFRHTADKPSSDMSMGLLTTSTEAPEGMRPYERRWAGSVWEDIKSQAKREAEMLIQRIILEMNKPALEESPEDEW